MAQLVKSSSIVNLDQRTSLFSNSKFSFLFLNCSYCSQLEVNCRNFSNASSLKCLFHLFFISCRLSSLDTNDEMRPEKSRSLSSIFADLLPKIAVIFRAVAAAAASIDASSSSAEMGIGRTRTKCPTGHFDE